MTWFSPVDGVIYTPEEKSKLGEAASEFADGATNLVSFINSRRDLSEKRRLELIYSFLTACNACHLIQYDRRYP